jgi:hypothetical protein
MDLDVHHRGTHAVGSQRELRKRGSRRSPSEDFCGEQSSVIGGQRIRSSAAPFSGVGRIFYGRLKTPPRSRRKTNRSAVPSKQLCVALQTRPESGPTVRERAEPQRVTRRELQSLIEQSVPDRPVVTLLGKIEGEFNHWLILSVSQQSPRRTTSLKTRFVNRWFSGSSSERFGTAVVCLFTRRCYPC